MLLAKRPPGQRVPIPEETLVGHLLAVKQSACALLDTVGDAVMNNLGTHDLVRMSRLLAVAAYLHDIGKANNHYQGMIYRTRTEPQAVRHELLTWWFLSQPDVAKWLISILGDDYEILLWICAGHHRRVPPDPPKDGTGLHIVFHGNDAQVKQVLEAMASDFHAGPPPQIGTVTLRPHEDVYSAIKASYVRSSRRFKTMNYDERCYVAVAKALLMSADAAGSSAHKRGHTPKQWIHDALSFGATRETFQSTVQSRLGSNFLRPFQEQVAGSTKRVTLIRAGCASGKTIAGYAWAGNRNIKRLYMCYPTTGTSTEGYRDYLLETVNDARLVHSRASVDMQMLRGCENIGETIDRQDALDLWSTPIIGCTVDTVLGLMQNQCLGLYAFPSFLHSGFIFDEAHAYDDRMFCALLDFMRVMRSVPVLIMTATMPDHRTQALRKALEHNQEQMEVIDGPVDLERLPRYKQCVTDDPRELARSVLNSGGKVLWVSNLVDRAIGVAHTCRDMEPILYHSRYRYIDRVKRHDEVIQAFRSDGPAFVVATQVAEMSLNISADLIITDVAPIAAMIQRLGRGCRNAAPGADYTPAQFVVLDVESGRPYGSSYMDLSWANDTQQWLSLLPDRVLSQADLVDAWQTQGQGKQHEDYHESAWLCGGYKTTTREVRDPSNYMIQVLMQEDAQKVRDRLVDPVLMRIPIPVKKNTPFMEWEELAHSRVVPDGIIHYDQYTGAQWI